MGHHVKSSKWNFYCYLTFMNKFSIVYHSVIECTFVAHVVLGDMT